MLSRSACFVSPLRNKCLGMVSVSFVIFLTKVYQDLTVKRLRIHLATWNVAEKKPMGSLEPLLGVDGPTLPDMIIVGFQEVTMKPLKAAINFLWDSDKWSVKLESVLAAKGYYNVGTVRMVGILLNVFALYEHKNMVYGVETDHVRTGLGGYYGNKGAVMMHLTMYGSKFCIINSHMAAHDDKLSERIDDYHDIDKKRYNACEPNADSFTFWLGDMNFRLFDPSLSAEKIGNLVKRNELQGLLARDQLKTTMEKGYIFSGFKEPEINFRPTFKYVVGTEDYNPKRRPAWTDRILYRTSDDSSLTVDGYTSLQGYDASDHKPVVADYTLTVQLE